MLTRNTKTISLIDIITALYCSYCILIINVDYYKYICLGLLLCWGISAFFHNKNALIKVLKNKATFYLLCFVFIAFVYSTITTGLIFGLKYSLTILINESPILIFLYYYNCGEGNNKNIAFIHVCVLAVIIVLCFNILKLLVIDPNAARLMAAYENVYSNKITGGGYQLTYAICIISPFILLIPLKSIAKTISVILFLFFSYTMIKCSYTIAILVYVLELFSLFVFNSNKKVKNKIYIAAVFITIIGLFFLFRKSIGSFISHYIANLFNGTFVYRRLQEFGDFLAGKAADNNGAVSRIELYKLSLETFFKHPLIGVSYITKFSGDRELIYSNYAISYIGEHSTILDGFARFGLLYFIYLLYLINAYKTLSITTEKSNIIKISFLSLLIVKLLNLGDVFGLNYVVAFFIPNIVLMINSNKTNKQDQPYFCNETVSFNNKTKNIGN